METTPLAAAVASKIPARECLTVDPVARELYGVSDPVFDRARARRAAEALLLALDRANAEAAGVRRALLSSPAPELIDAVVAELEWRHAR